MKAGDLIDLLMTCNDDEIEIKVYETISGKYVDTTAAVTIAAAQVFHFLLFIALSAPIMTASFWPPR